MLQITQDFLVFRSRICRSDSDGDGNANRNNRRSSFDDDVSSGCGRRRNSDARVGSDSGDGETDGVVILHIVVDFGLVVAGDGSIGGEDESVDIGGAVEELASGNTSNCSSV